MSYTIASFLREKAQNMAKWLAETGYEGVVNMPSLTDLEIVAMAQALHDHCSAAVKARDFDQLTQHEIPPDLLSVIDYVKSETGLQDKFWRYLTLFSDTVTKHE